MTTDSQQAVAELLRRIEGHIAAGEATIARELAGRWAAALENTIDTRRGEILSNIIWEKAGVAGSGVSYVQEPHGGEDVQEE